MKRMLMSGIKKGKQFAIGIVFTVQNIPYTLLLFFILSCNLPVQDREFHKADILKPADTLSYLKEIDSVGAFLQTGDLVFRRGNDFASQTFANMNQEDKRFSHVGFLSIQGGTALVYHCLGGSFNPDQKILKEPLSKFLSPKSNLAFGFYRFTPLLNKFRLQKSLDSLYAAGIPFDLKFDLKTDDRLYCSELVYKLIKKDYPGIDLKISESGGVKYVSTETFTLCPEAKQIFFWKLQ